MRTGLFKKVLITQALFAVFAACPVFCMDQFGGFKALADSGSLKPFAWDLGSILGAATFHNGRSLGFKGFDVGVRGGSLLRPRGGDRILRDNGVTTVGMPWVQAESGLPLGVDGYIRGISYQGVTIAGGGLRYGIHQSDKVKTFSFLAAASAHSVAHRYFSASHQGLNVISSYLLKRMTAYMGAGADRTRLVVRCIPDSDATQEAKVVTVWGSRFTAGVSVIPFPKDYFYMHGAYTLTAGNSGFEGGFGIRY